jgi:hypothetical protein
MTPKEKASELIVNYQLQCKSLDYQQAKQCALILVDEIIDALAEYDERNNTYELQNMDRDFLYWLLVFSELQSL